MPYPTENGIPLPLPSKQRAQRINKRKPAPRNCPCRVRFAMLIGSAHFHHACRRVVRGGATFARAEVGKTEAVDASCETAAPKRRECG